MYGVFKFGQGSHRTKIKPIVVAVYVSKAGKQITKNNPNRLSQIGAKIKWLSKSIRLSSHRVYRRTATGSIRGLINNRLKEFRFSDLIAHLPEDFKSRVPLSDSSSTPGERLGKGRSLLPEMSQTFRWRLLC